MYSLVKFSKLYYLVLFTKLYNLFRFEARWYRGEKSSKYLKRLEKQRYNQNCIVKKDGTISRNQKEILMLQSEFYKEIYQSDPDIEFTFMNQSHVQLSEDYKLDLEQPLSLDKLATAIKSMQRVKPPGFAGLPWENYSYMWDKIGKHLHNAVIQLLKERRIEMVCL